MKVLLIEDDEIVGRLIAQQLTFQNFEVIRASNGIHAIDLYLNNAIDVIISDLLMPEMSGFTALKTIQLISKNKTPLIIISSLNDIPLMLKNAEVTYDAYIQKPFSAQQLIDKIHNAVDLKWAI
jgi:DNA-binding response OmpR family regulator